MWVAVMLGSLGCYLLKLAGVSLPRRVLENQKVQHVATLLPVALLTGLIVIQTFTLGHKVVIDARAGGLLAAFVLVLLRAPFLVVVTLACVTTALLRLAM